MELKRVEVVSGPGPIKWDLQDGVLYIWVGRMAVKAPKTAKTTEIAYKYNTWVMQDETTPSESVAAVMVEDRGKDQG